MKACSVLALTMVTLLSAGAMITARADEILKFRHVQHSASFQSQNVGDANGHSLSLYQLPGIAFFPDGSTGSTTVIGVSDVTNGSGTLNGYYTVNFSDGSALWLKYSGTVAAVGTKSPRRGTATVLGGKGRYEGAKGDGTWEGDGTQVGAAAISYIDNVINIKK